MRPAARWGAVLFRNRSWLPVPFLLVALLVPAHPTSRHWMVAGVLIVVGEWIRLAGVAAAGTVTRRRSRDVQRLVNYGIFAWMRNPLYVGNFLIWMGFVIASGLLWFLPIAVFIFAIEYTLIAASAGGEGRGAPRLGRGLAQRNLHLSSVHRARGGLLPQAALLEPIATSWDVPADCRPGKRPCSSRCTA